MNDHTFGKRNIMCSVVILTLNYLEINICLLIFVYCLIFADIADLTSILMTIVDSILQHNLCVFIPILQRLSAHAKLLKSSKSQGKTQGSMYLILGFQHLPCHRKSVVVSLLLCLSSAK